MIETSGENALIDVHANIVASLKVLDEQRADAQRSAPVIHKCVAWTNALRYEFVEGI